MHFSPELYQQSEGRTGEVLCNVLVWCKLSSVGVKEN